MAVKVSPRPYETVDLICELIEGKGSHECVTRVARENGLTIRQVQQVWHRVRIGVEYDPA